MRTSETLHEGLKPSYRSGIIGDLGIHGKKRNPFHCGLSNQYAVEGIFVKRWQKIKCEGMFADDWKLPITVIDEAATKKAGINNEVATP